VTPIKCKKTRFALMVPTTTYPSMHGECRTDWISYTLVRHANRKRRIKLRAELENPVSESSATDGAPRVISPAYVIDSQFYHCPH